jgi:hypothetical protein
MTLRTVLFSGLVAGALGGAVPVLAGPQPALALQSFQGRSDRAAVVRSFRSVLKRDPHPYELRRYALLMNDYGWTEQDVRGDLRQRSDYRRYSAGSAFDTDAVITRAYEDILEREPDPASMQSHRRHIMREGWSEQDVRQALRQSPEYGSTAKRTASADRIIGRAYQDVLNRQPDPGGLNTYRRAIIEAGWDEQDLRQVLLRSDEYREQRGDTAARRGDGGTAQQEREGRATSQREGGAASRREDSGATQREDRAANGGQDNVTQIVRSAYLAVLHREPDAGGLRDYGLRVTRDNWTQADIEKGLRDSAEFKQKNR